MRRRAKRAGQRLQKGWRHWDILLGDGGVVEKLKLGATAGAFYAKWFPTLTVGPGQSPRAFAEFGSLARHLRYAERSSRKLARSTF